MNVSLSAEVSSYIRNLVTTVLRNSARARARSEIEKVKTEVSNIIGGDFSQAKSYFRKLSTVAVRRPKAVFGDVIKLAKGEANILAEDPIWLYVRFMLMLVISPIIEVHVAGQKVLTKPDTYSRSLKSVLRWSGIESILPSELLQALKETMAQ